MHPNHKPKKYTYFTADLSKIIGVLYITVEPRFNKIDKFNNAVHEN